MSRRIWTFPELYDAARALESGRSQADVAADYGVSASTLRSQLGRNGIAWKRQPRGPKLRHGLMLQFVAARNRGLTWRQVRDAVAPEMEVQTVQKATQRYSAREGNKIKRGRVA